MAQLTIYVDDITEARLRLLSVEHGRTPEDLAASAVEEAALHASPATPVWEPPWTPPERYTCPVCHLRDGNAYVRCNRPDCTDGRDPRG